MKATVLILAIILLISMDGTSQGYGPNHEFFNQRNYYHFDTNDPPQVTVGMISSIIGSIPPIPRDIVVLTLSAALTAGGIAIWNSTNNTEDDWIGFILGIPMTSAGILGILISGISLGIHLNQRSSTTNTVLKIGLINYQSVVKCDYLALYPTPGISLIIHF